MKPRSSTIRRLHKRCGDCGEHHYIDPSNANDFAETVEGYVRQSFCGGCGLMQPNLREDEDYISNDEPINEGLKKKVTMKIGRSHGVDHHLSKKLLESFRDIYMKKEFITDLSDAYPVLFNVKISEKEIRSFM